MFFPQTKREIEISIVFFLKIINLQRIQRVIIGRLTLRVKTLREVLGLYPGLVTSDTASSMACHRCDVSSELWFPDAKLQRWTLPGLGKIDCNRYSIAIFFTFCSSNALDGAFTFLNEYQILALSLFIFRRNSIFHIRSFLSRFLDLILVNSK